MILRDFVNERILFSFSLLLIIIVIWSFPAVSTIDGYIHAVNAKLIVDLLMGQCPIATQVFQFNQLLVPNWTTHIFMAILIFFGISLSHADAIVFTLCTIIPSIGLRQIPSINKKSRILSWLSISFAFNQMVINGNYNFACATSIFLYTIGYYFRHIELKKPIKLFLLLVVLTLFAWFSHILGFLFMGMIILIHEIKLILDKNPPLRELHSYFFSRWPIWVAFLPGIILTSFYMHQNFIHYVFQPVSLMEGLHFRLNRLITMADFDPFLIYPSLPLQMFYTAVATLMLYSLFSKSYSNIRDPVFFTCLLAALIFWFIGVFANDSYLGGWMVNSRFNIAGWYMVFACLGRLSWHRAERFAIITTLLFAIMLNLAIYQNRMTASLEVLRKVTAHAPNISDNTIIYSFDLVTAPYTDFWHGMMHSTIMSRSIGNLLTERKKCVVDLNNYEASLDTFPLRFKPSIPILSITGKPKYFPEAHVYNYNVPDLADFQPQAFEQSTGLTIAYILLWGDNDIHPPQFLQNDLINHYFKTYYPLVHTQLEDLIQHDYSHCLPILLQTKISFAHS